MKTTMLLAGMLVSFNLSAAAVYEFKYAAPEPAVQAEASPAAAPAQQTGAVPRADQRPQTTRKPQADTAGTATDAPAGERVVNTGPVCGTGASCR